MRSKALFLVLLVLIGSVLACTPLVIPTLIPTYTPTPPPAETPTLFLTDTPTPTETPTPFPTDTPTPQSAEVTPALLDVCTLLTPEEVEAVLRSPVTVLPAPETGNCSYVAELGEGDMMPVTVALGAGHGEEGKAIMLVSVAILTFFTGGSEAAQENFERLESALPDMTMQEVVAELVLVLESVGFEVIPYEGVGDAAYWLWFEQEGVSIGELIIVRGESWLTIAVVGQPEDEALQTVEALAGTALERLPPAFFVLPPEE
ncbi:MAG: hypothetical protein JW918_00010 [Anaerolineae bacterium]|nr:hypothetical protein [Anaerolineae bacterium]